jgi:hypothetical protein
MGLSCSRLVEVTSGRRKGIGHVPAYHLGGEARELAWSRDVACTDSLQERRGWAGVSKGRVDELDVAGRVLLANVVSREPFGSGPPRLACVVVGPRSTDFRGLAGARSKRARNPDLGR